MKKLSAYILAFIALTIMSSCDEGIDPITSVSPGADAGPPTVVINSPNDGDVISEFKLTSSVQIDFDVEDDIEIQMISVDLDGEQLAIYNSFTDYRIFGDQFTRDNITFGNHILTVSATDIGGETTTVSVNFTKPPYSPIFSNEIFYMPFDKDFGEYVSMTAPSQIGNPMLAGDKFLGIDAYKGAQDSYLSFPMGDMLGDTFTGMFWYKVNTSPDRAGLLVLGDDETDRLQGFRLFREGSSLSQTIKLNVGTGSGESWNNGGNVSPNDEWINVAFSVSPTETAIYLNGALVNTSTPSGAIDWTNCNDLIIGAGGPTFSYWNHLSDESPMDELRFFNTAMTQSEIQNVINTLDPYDPLYDETFYMPFEGSYTDLVGQNDATQVGTPSFAGESYSGINAYMSTTDSYITYPIADVFGSSQEFSATFWYKVNATPDRAGILTVGDDAADRFQGFRLFREGSGTEQRIKANIGIGTGESWNDGDVIDVAAGEWVHVALTVSSSESKIYFNGVEVNSATLGSPVDWTGCSEIVIGSGGPTFSYWNHLSDSSALDELRLYNFALSQTDIQAML
ncbi:MAG TPA: LamG domain-containing protein [Flavobacteriaceae bacterium]|nr:LamG domain-containing protein [Flavobacteriaceae bacterium]